MDVTSLPLLLREGGAVLLPDGGLQVVALPSWIVAGEDRLSYTMLVRLIECCREHHWERDMLPLAGDTPIDSITKSLEVNFVQPVLVGRVIAVRYRVVEARDKGYTLQFYVRDVASEGLCAECTLVSVFYDPQRHRVSAPPASISAYLLAANAHSA